MQQDIKIVGQLNLGVEADELFAQTRGELDVPVIHKLCQAINPVLFINK